MKHNRVFYELHTLSRTPGYPLREWYEAAKQTWICPGCLTPNLPPGPVDVQLAYPPDNAAINIVTGIGVGYAQRAFLDAVGVGQGRANFHLGRVLVDGVERSDFATFRGDRVLFIRGNSESPGRICDVCGRQLYSPRLPHYLLSHDLTGDDIYESQLHQLVVVEEVYQRLMEWKWSKLGRHKIPVRTSEM